MPCLTNLPPVHVQKLGTHPRTLAIRLDSEPNDHYTSSCCEQCPLLTQLDIGRQWLAEIAQLVEHATENRGVRSSILRLGTMRKWLSGRASPCQGEGRRFDPGLPLQRESPSDRGAFCLSGREFLTDFSQHFKFPAGFIAGIWEQGSSDCVRDLLLHFCGDVA